MKKIESDSIAKNAIITVVILIALFVMFLVTKYASLNLSYSSKLRTPAALYEIGDIVNVDYQVVGTDKNNTLWLKKRDDDSHVYIAVVSSDYFDLSFSEKFDRLSNTELNENITVEITE